MKQLLPFQEKTGRGSEIWKTAASSLKVLTFTSAAPPKLPSMESIPGRAYNWWSGLICKSLILVGVRLFLCQILECISNEDLDCSNAAADDGEQLRQVSLLEVAEDVMRRQGTQKLRASGYTRSLSTSLKKTNNVDLHIDREQSRRFCVNMPCIPLNLEVPLPTLYALTESAFAHLTS